MEVYKTASRCVRELKASKLLVAATLLCISFIASLQATNNIWHLGDSATDSSVFQYIARVIIEGGMPYRDSFDHKGPLIYIINVLGLLIDKDRGLWVLELVTIFFTVTFMYKIARFFLHPAPSVAVVFLSLSAFNLFFDEGNLTEEYAMPFIALSIYAFLKYLVIGSISKVEVLLTGLSLGAICMLRINMCAVWLVMCPVIIFRECKRKEFKKLTNLIVWFAFGFLALTCPIIVWLLHGNAFKGFFEDYIIFNMEYSSFGEPSEMWVAREATFMYFINSTVILLALAFAFILACVKRSVFEISYAVFMVVALVLLSMSGRTYGHYGLIIVPMLVYPYAAGWKCMTKEVCSRNLSLIFAAYLIVTIALPVWIPLVNTAFQSASTKDRPPVQTYARQIAQIVKENSADSDNVLVCGNLDIIYNLSNRFTSTKYSYQDPPLAIDDIKAKDFFDEIQDDLPKVVVLPEKTWGHREILDILEANDYKNIGSVRKSEDSLISIYLAVH